MLKTLSLRNFKAWQKLDVEFASVTGLFGTNSSGKSSVLQFLLMLKQTKNATDRGLVLDFGGPDQFVNLGSYADLVFMHDLDKDLSWSVGWTLNQPLDLYDTSGKRKQILVSDVNFQNTAKLRWRETVECESMSYSLGEFKFLIERKKADSTEYQLRAEVPASSSFRFIRNQSRVWALPGPIKTHLFPDQAKTYFQNSDFLGVIEATYESLLNDIYYLGPLREPPKREYPWSGASPNDVGRRGELAVAAILAATSRKETRNLGFKTRRRSFQEIIAYWLQQLGLIYKFRIEEIGSGANLYRAKVRRDSKSPEALLTDIGFGVSQVLPAIVLLYYVPEGSTVLMEQPEIHLHPAVQSGFADLILTVAKTRNLQVVVESHSEHLLRRFQRRIAEGSMASDNVKLYFSVSDAGASSLVPLEMDEFGEIKNWPEHFFGDEMNEIAETRKAILKRKAMAQAS